MGEPILVTLPKIYICRENIDTEVAEKLVFYERSLDQRSIQNPVKYLIWGFLQK